MQWSRSLTNDWLSWNLVQPELEPESPGPMFLVLGVFTLSLWDSEQETDIWPRTAAGKAMTRFGRSPVDIWPTEAVISDD